MSKFWLGPLTLFSTEILNFMLKLGLLICQILKSIKFMNNDKKKDDEKISLILLRNIGKTTTPGKFKYKISKQPKTTIIRKK